MANNNQTTPTPSNSLSNPDLLLTHPTHLEETLIATLTFPSWGDSLPVSAYLHEYTTLQSAPLARNSGRIPWILTSANAPPDERPILSSCETFRKRALTNDKDGTVTEGVVYGVASVFTPPNARGQGYAGKLMEELKEVLKSWQGRDGGDGQRVIGSILFSDIGKKYYARWGWLPSGRNCYTEFDTRKADEANEGDVELRFLVESDLEELCKNDEAMIRKSIATSDPGNGRRVCIVPDAEHFGWHRAKETIACEHIFGKVPAARGVIVGEPGKRIWIVWTRRYYSHPESKEGDNVLYINRLVFENDETTIQLVADEDKISAGSVYDQQWTSLRAILQVAQREARTWKLETIQLWNPSPLVHHMIQNMGLNHKEVERESEHIASALWFTEDGDARDTEAMWINNEYYAWC